MEAGSFLVEVKRVILGCNPAGWLYRRLVGYFVVRGLLPWPRRNIPPRTLWRRSVQYLSVSTATAAVDESVLLGGGFVFLGLALLVPVFSCMCHTNPAGIFFVCLLNGAELPRGKVVVGSMLAEISTAGDTGNLSLSDAWVTLFHTSGQIR